MGDICIHDAGDAPAKDLERGCEAARKLIESRGFTVQQAYDAALHRANNERYDRKAAKAWDDAEDAAFAEAFGSDDDWPDDAVLGLTSAPA